MDNLLLLTPTKKSHKAKIRRFIESLTQKWTKDFAEEMSIVEKRIKIYG